MDNALAVSATAVVAPAVAAASSSGFWHFIGYPLTAFGGFLGGLFTKAKALNTVNNIVADSKSAAGALITDAEALAPAASTIVGLTGNPGAADLINASAALLQVATQSHNNLVQATNQGAPAAVLAILANQHANNLTAATATVNAVTGALAGAATPGATQAMAALASSPQAAKVMAIASAVAQGAVALKSASPVPAAAPVAMLDPTAPVAPTALPGSQP